jgi:hypothetical protein
LALLPGERFSWTPHRCHGLTKNKVTMAFPLFNDPSMEQPIIYISINYRVSGEEDIQYIHLFSHKS